MLIVMEELGKREFALNQGLLFYLRHVVSGSVWKSVYFNVNFLDSGSFKNFLKGS